MSDTHHPLETITRAISLRDSIIQSKQKDFNKTNTCRMFNGFYEGLPGLVLDRYGSALVIFDHSETNAFEDVINQVKLWALANDTSIESILLKQRNHPQPAMRQGKLLAGDQHPSEITENGVRYTIDLQLHQDASFYLDTRNLRQWLIDNLAGKRVLNTFAYTGSLGVAAGVGGADLVVQTDLNHNYLEIAKQSWMLNQLPAEKHQHIKGDFFRVTGRMRNDNLLFDCVILDPPFFSTTGGGKVDLQFEMTRLINKARPLVAHEGLLIVINNALFHSGVDFMAELETLCQSEYLNYQQSIPIPMDITGYPETILSTPPVDPAPFNHPTKIAILKVYRKDRRK